MTSLPEAETETMKRVAREFLDTYRLLSVNLYIEIVHVGADVIEQFTYNLNATMKEKDKMYTEAVKEGDKDFEYGTLPGLLKLKALQEKEIKAAIESKLRRGNNMVDFDQDADQTIINAKKLNSHILEKSQDSSLVITNLPPLIPG